MIIALAGRRIDERNASYTRFPEGAIPAVKARIGSFFVKKQVTTLVSSGACGSDLLAQESADELGINGTVILPFNEKKFRTTSVVDRPGDWGPVYDKIIKKRKDANRLEVKNYDSEDWGAYGKINLDILDAAEKLAQQTGEDLLVLIVWEGKPKASEDLTNEFKLEAIKRQIKVEEIVIPLTKLDLIDITRNALRGQWNSSDDLKALYKKLAEWDQFSYASEVLLAKIKQDQAAGIAISLAEHQKLANFIYKDHSLPSSFKFNRALQELNAFDDLNKTEKCETLGLAGAIYKYKWLYDHQEKNLDLSSYYYKRGFESWQRYIANQAGDECNDSGYTAINYAYSLELKAIDKLEEAGAVMDVGSFAESQISEANKVRQFIIDQFVDSASTKLKKDNCDSWVVATVAEAYIGLRSYELALKFIRDYKQREKEDAHAADPTAESDDKVVAWKMRTFTRQLYSIAYLQNIQVQWKKKAGIDKKIKTQSAEFAKGIDVNEITKCLNVLSERADSGSEMEIRREGKVGLALSGGGFRSALFHIGVLAALAERDKLKDVEVISCVSGGSIVGAFYYLELKNEMSQNTKVDYVKVVKNVEVKFLKGIQKNLRMRVINNISCNFRMIFDKTYSRTHRLGELYEKHLFSLVDEKHKGPFYMSDLFITPKDGPGDFNINTDNFNRKYKVPQLILNATAVNTGHNWQFTASWMGEPPGSIEADIDVKPRLRRMYYKDAPGKYKKFRLGHAVGASSCVPVLFTPMPLYDLYPDDPKKEKIELQLIDGGLHDNQGIASLLEQECKNMIISDASGQMPTTMGSEANPLSVFFRADTILQERLRELQFRDLKERAYTTQINELTTLHLKKDLQQMPVSWLHCTDPPRTIYNEAWCEGPNEFTKYGVLKSVQRLLSEIRTDLDSFNDTEAYGLMYSGFEQTHCEYDRREGVKFARGSNWNFLAIKNFLTVPERAVEIEKVLIAGKKVPFKLLELSTGLKVATYTVIGLISLAVLIVGIMNWCRTIYFPVDVSTLVFPFIILLIGLFSKTIASWFNIKTTLRRKAILVVVMTVAFFVSNIYLGVFNGLYNKLGKLKK